MNQPRDMLAQITLMNRVHAALSSSIKSDDVYVLILATLTSPSGLNFQRGMLFLYDRQGDRLRGHLAMGPATEEEAHERLAELEAERRALAQIAATLAAERGDEEGGPSANDRLAELQESSYWISMLQQHSPTTALTQQVRDIELSERTPRAQLAAGARPRLIDLLSSPQPRIMARGELLLSPTLNDILAEQVILVPLTTNSGPCGLVVLDRRFAEDEALAPAHLEPLGWYLAQVGMALENAELFTSLQRAYDSLREIDKIKSNFLSTISHELRTPLTAIGGFVDLMIEGRVGEMSATQRDLLKRVQLQSIHLTNIVNDLIEVAEVQMGGLDEFDLDEVDPLNCLINVLPRIEPRRKGKNISIEPQLETEVPLIRCNSRALERIYYHLLDNAVKFIEGTGQVAVNFRRDGRFLHIDIRDSGIGIPPEHLRRIFDQFFQIDNNLARDRNGMGLGLTITKILLDATKGTINVESSPGEGSTFTVSYPVWREDVDAAPAEL